MPESSNKGLKFGPKKSPKNRPKKQAQIWHPNGGSIGDSFQFSYCWWLKSGKLTSWGKGSLSRLFTMFHTSQLVGLGISEPSTVPKQSMYGIFPYIYHKNQPNVGEYTSPMDGMGYDLFWIINFPLVFHEQTTPRFGMYGVASLRWCLAGRNQVAGLWCHYQCGRLGREFQGWTNSQWDVVEIFLTGWWQLTQFIEFSPQKLFGEMIQVD